MDSEHGIQKIVSMKRWFIYGKSRYKFFVLMEMLTTVIFLSSKALHDKTWFTETSLCVWFKLIKPEELMGTLLLSWVYNCSQMWIVEISFVLQFTINPLDVSVPCIYNGRMITEICQHWYESTDQETRSLFPLWVELIFLYVIF